jgi:hypothetical protein
MATKKPAADKAEDLQENQEPLPAQSTPESEDVLRNIDQLSRGAYTAFAERMQYKDYSDMSLPLYHEMTAVQKAAWESVVRVVHGALP